MPKIQYQTVRFTKKRLLVIAKANEIITEYQNQGFDLTLRQLYYQFVARDLIPNSQQEYKKLGDAINEGRLAGLIDWNAIVDRTRNLRDLPHWDSPESIMKSAENGFRLSKWDTQGYRPEVWIEKDALIGVIAGICEEHDVPYFSCRGYTSQSEMWSAAMRIHRYVKAGQTPIILHFGDHDPSGKDMTRDIEDRLQLFMGGLEVRRLALNMDQIREYNPPPNFAKVTDSRADAYIKEFGDESWELDALEPSVLAALVRDEIRSLRDDEQWQEVVEKEENERGDLSAIRENWEQVIEFLRNEGLR